MLGLLYFTRVLSANCYSRSFVTGRKDNLSVLQQNVAASTGSDVSAVEILRVWLDTSLQHRLEEEGMISMYPEHPLNFDAMGNRVKKRLSSLGHPTCRCREAAASFVKGSEVLVKGSCGLLGFFLDLSFIFPSERILCSWSFDGPHGTNISSFSAPFRSEKTLELNPNTVLGLLNPRENVLSARGLAPELQSSSLSHEDLDPWTPFTPMLSHVRQHIPSEPSSGT